MKDLRAFSDAYHKLLTTKFAGINLTRILDTEDFYNKQILDSILPYDHSDIFKQSLLKNKLHIDIGFGGGFPILPLKFHVEHPITSIGIESKRKKCDVVGEIAQDLDLKVNLIHARVEHVVIDVPATLTFKAVGKVNDFLSKIQTSEYIQVFFYKGPGFYEQEENQLEIAMKQWDLIEEQTIDVPGVEQRILVGFQNKKKVLRRTNSRDIVVKVSEII